MSTFWQRLFPARAQLTTDAPPPAWALALTEQSQALTEQSQRAARAQAKLALSVEALGASIEAKLDAQKQRIDGLAAELPPSARFDWTPLLDALDRLEALGDDVRSAGDAEMASGLAMIGARLGQQVEAAGLRRERGLGAAVDGSAMQVVATELHIGIKAGSVVRCLRAAVWRDNELVRQGEVVVAVAPPMEETE